VGGLSIDQLCAARIGNLTPLPVVSGNSRTCIFQRIEVDSPLHTVMAHVAAPVLYPAAWQHPGTQAKPAALSATPYNARIFGQYGREVLITPRRV